MMCQEGRMCLGRIAARPKSKSFEFGEAEALLAVQPPPGHYMTYRSSLLYLIHLDCIPNDEILTGKQLSDWIELKVAGI